MDEERVPPPRDEPLEPVPELPGERSESLADLLRAVALGIRDTASDMVAAGRQGAAEAYDDMWQQFEAKTKRRRQQREDEE